MTNEDRQYLIAQWRAGIVEAKMRLRNPRDVETVKICERQLVQYRANIRKALEEMTPC